MDSQKTEMENTQPMPQAVTQAAIEAVRAKAQLMWEAAGHTERDNTAALTPSTTERSNGLALKQLT